MNYPQPPSHRTFSFGNIVIDSNFDSGNCFNAQKVSNNHFNIWIATDHPKNNYRTWFYFSAQGFKKGTQATFTIKNMQNQSKLLFQGLVPVYRESSSEDWKRIKSKVNTDKIQYYDGWIQWSFKHIWTTDQKVYLAFFYPWSNHDNKNFLNKLEEKIAKCPQIYFHRTSIISSIEGREIEFLTISSKKGLAKGKEEPIHDENLFRKGQKPLTFEKSKKHVVVGARVHPGEVPGSHVMTGILEYLTETTKQANILRDHFVFNIFPIFNPDGVGRGHYRVDTNGINLNRCYMNPTAKNQPSIYAVRKIIMHLYAHNKFFAFLDLHAHATRKGTFIYGNYTSQLSKQVDICLFPKILSMNSIDFEYEGSNFTQKNMYCKDRADHISKQGSGRVAIFKATKNPNCWTLQCNYNMSRVHNILQNRKLQQDEVIKPNQESLCPKILAEYRYPPQQQAKTFFTIETYRKLGHEICESLLDLVEKNIHSRIENPHNHYKSVQNLKINLAVALLRMDSNRFEIHFRKLYNAIANPQNQEIYNRALKALYYYFIKNAKIQNINAYIKDGDQSQVLIHTQKKARTLPTNNRNVQYNSLGNRVPGFFRNKKSLKMVSDFNTEEFLQEKKREEDNDLNILTAKMAENLEKLDQVEGLILDKLKGYEMKKQHKRIPLKFQQFRLVNINAVKKISKFKDARQHPASQHNKVRFRIQQVPLLNKRTSLIFTPHEPVPERVFQGYSVIGNSKG